VTAAVEPAVRALHAPPANAEQTDHGRFYVHPVTDERFMSVTTALKATPKDGLPPWAAGLAAAMAFTELPRLVVASRKRACGRSYARCEHDYTAPCDGCPCGDCRECVEKVLKNQHWVESSRRADEGTRVHKAIEHWVLHDGVWPTVDDDIKPYLKTFLQFVVDYGLTPESWEMTEGTILNRADGWGGTLDAHLRISWGRTELADDFCARLDAAGRDVVVTADAKTREKPKPQLYEDHSMQLAAYRRGEVILLRDGTEHPLPATDGGAILQLRPDGYLFRPVVTDDDTYGAFLGALRTYRWIVERGAASISSRSFPLPEAYKRDKANRKARARRTTAKAAGAPQSVHRFPMNGAKPAAKPAPAAKTTATKTAPPAAARRTTAESLGIPRDAFSGPRTLSDDTIPF
jgi:hypothetical protein